MTRFNVDNSWRDEINAFADAIFNNQPIAFGSSLDAIKTMQLVYRIYCADVEWRNLYQLQDTIPEVDL